MTTRTVHHWLLWALERLAWSTAHVGRAALVLAILTRLDLGGKDGNRPGQSLRNIFLIWYPQSSATHEQRLQILDMLREQEGAVAWKLMLAIIPKFQDMSSPIDIPRWREWRPEGYQPNPTSVELWNDFEAIVSRLVVDAKADIEHLSNLVELAGELPHPLRAIVLGSLELLDPSTLDDPQNILWTRLREQMSRHRRHAHARWAMPSQDVDRLSSLYVRLTPPNLIKQYAWLFVESPPLLEVGADEDIHAYHRTVRQTQIHAVSQVFNAEGISGLLSLCEKVSNAYLLGIIIGENHMSEDAEAQLFVMLGSSNLHFRHMACGYVVGRFRTGQWEWADGYISNTDGIALPKHRADFFLSLPHNSQAWDRLDQESDVIQELYWMEFPGFVNDPTDCMRAVKQLLKHDRAWQALRMIAHCLEKIAPPVEEVLDILEAARATTMQGDVDHSLQYDVGSLLDYVSQANDIDQERLGRVEWAFVPLFRYEHRSFKVLHSLLANDPNFFADLVSLIYCAEDESSRDIDEETRLRARAASDLLDSASIVPGMQINGLVDQTILMDWLAEVRQLLSERKRAVFGDYRIGRLLYHACSYDENLWSPYAIRDIIEKVKSEDLEHGVFAAVHDSRGVTTRAVFGGGEQEKQLAVRYRTLAKSLQMQWPRTAALVRSLAQSYENEAQMHDLDADLRQDL